MYLSRPERMSSTARSEPMENGGPASQIVPVAVESKHSALADTTPVLVPSWAVWAVAGVCFVSGTMCNVAVKLQNREVSPVCDGCAAEGFNQPFWQTFIMFCGEALCLFAFWFDRWWGARKGFAGGVTEFATVHDLSRRQSPWFWWIFPAFLDLSGTAIINVAFTMTYASTVQMMRNFILVVNAIITIIMMRRPIRVHEWIGIVIMTAGMIASGVQAMMTPDESSSVNSDLAWLGIVLTLLGTVLNGVQLIVEEKFLEKAYMPPLKGVGVEGFCGGFLNIIAIIVSHYAGFWNFKHGWYQMNHNGAILAGNIWYLVVVFIFNGSGLGVTKLGSGLLRSVIYSCRAPVLFLVEMALGWQSFSAGAMVGLILSVIGFLFYAYALPGLGKQQKPATYKKLRKGVPCFCTKELPDTDDEEEPTSAQDVEV